MTEEKSEPAKNPSKKFRLSSSGKIYLGLFLGAACGLFFGEMVSWLQVVGDIFIKLLQITVIPYISLSLITGIGGLNYKEVMAHAVKGGGIFLLISAITLVIVMLIPLSFPEWPSASFFSTQQVEEPPTIDFLRLFIPSNPFHAYAFALVPAIVVFSILAGIALIGIPNNAALLEPLKVFHTAMMKITGIVGKLAPIGVFALIASAAGTFVIEDLTRLQVYIIVYALIALVLSLLILPGIITVFTPFKYKHIRKALRTPMITAFATGSSLIVLPMLIQQCKQLIADYSLRAVLDQDEADASVEVLIPSFYTFPSPAGLLSIAFVLFAGWYIGSDVSVADYPLLVLVGVPSLFGGTLLTIPSLLDLLRLPNDLFQVFVSIDVIIVRFGTLIAAMHYATIALIGTMALVGHIRLRWFRLLRVAFIGTALIVPILFGVRTFYSTVVVAPYTMADMLKSLNFLGTPQPAKLYAEVPEELMLAGEEPASLAQIENRGVLRVCYQPDEYPSAFVNNTDPMQLVGFDVEMAHGFAEMLQLPLEFLPAETEGAAITLLNRGVCDVYMRTLPVNPRRSQEFGLTSPVYRSSLGLIVRDYRRHEFYRWEDFNKHGDSLRLGVEDTPGYVERLSLFTGATIVPIQDMEQKLRLLESGAEDIDAIADMAEEGAALTILYPNFSTVVPRPPVFLPVSYAVARGNSDLLLALNSWLLMKKEEGVIEALYRHWMLGGAAKAEKLPRWSVIRNALGWVE
ncbi:MAG: cation:dicarboxylase symporter family transporter [Desulfobacterales bacterium]|nr:cation:dicarboxylase symporter family transporter [Desulfobacterales bacterium]